MSKRHRIQSFATNTDLPNAAFPSPWTFLTRDAVCELDRPSLRLLPTCMGRRSDKKVTTVTVVNPLPKLWNFLSGRSSGILIAPIRRTFLWILCGVKWWGLSRPRRDGPSKEEGHDCSGSSQTWQTFPVVVQRIEDYPESHVKYCHMP